MLLLVVGAVEAVAWSLVTPALQGADEAAHFSYTQRLVERGELPHTAVPGTQVFSGDMALASRWAGLAATEGNRSARPAWTDLEARLYEEAEAGLSGSGRSDGTGANPARNNPPLFYGLGAAGYGAGYGGDFFTRLSLMRLVNVPLFLLVIGLTWALIAELLPRPGWARTLGAGSVALHPQLAHFAGVFTPDLLLSAIWAAFAYFAVLLVRRGPRPKLLAAVILLSGASVMSHPRGIPILAAAALAIGIAAVRHRPRVRKALPWVAGLVALAAVPVLVYTIGLSSSGESVIRGSAVTGATANAFNLREFASYVWQFYLPQLPGMELSRLGEEHGATRAFVRYFYGAFAWQEVLFAPAVYTVLRALSLVGLIALAVAAVRRRAQLRRHLPALAVLATLLVTLLGMLHYSEYRELLNHGSGPQIVGRYLFPLMPLFGLAIAFAVASLPRRVAGPAAGAVIALGCLLQIGGLGLTLARFYA